MHLEKLKKKKTPKREQKRKVLGKDFSQQVSTNPSPMNHIDGMFNSKRLDEQKEKIRKKDMII